MVDEAPTAAAPVDTPQQPQSSGPSDKDVSDQFKTRIEASKRFRKQFSNEWRRNVELRIGKIAARFTGGINTTTTDLGDDVQSEINPDWALTKTKTANLYSQVPTVQLTHENKQYEGAIAPFAKALNYEIGEKRTNMGVVMEEILNDVVNAAGVGALMIGFAGRFETVQMPQEESINGPQGPIPTASIPPNLLQELAAQGAIHMVPTERPTDSRFFATRVPPTALLWPSEFTGSNFDDGDFIGHAGDMSWSEAVHDLKLTPDQKEKATTGLDIPAEDSLRSNPDRGGLMNKLTVHYDEIFYWRYRVDPEEPSFSAIWRLVFVHGIDKAVIHEPWKGQQLDPQSRKYVGSCKFPIRVLTVTYISDNPIPPSDSAAGRPQVDDMRRSRSQMFANRERSIPIRWYDVNRIDPLLQAQLMKGTYQGMIPTNGDGNRSIGEIARASYPSEDLAFDQATKTDLLEMWQIGPNQLGTTQQGRKTSAEITTTQQNFATRIGQERNRVAMFFLGAVDVLAGYMALYSDFPTLTQQERQAMQQAWDNKHILHDLVFKVRPDSTIVIGTEQRLERIFRFLNNTAKSGYVAVKPLLLEAAELSGIDPTDVIIDPPPKAPEEPNISYRFSGKDDLINPIVMAMLASRHLAPSIPQIEDAKKLLLAAQMPPAPTAPDAMPSTAGPAGAPGPLPPGPGAPLAPGQDVHPDWVLSNKIAKRSRDGG